MNKIVYNKKIIAIFSGIEVAPYNLPSHNNNLTKKWNIKNSWLTNVLFSRHCANTEISRVNMAGDGDQGDGSGKYTYGGGGGGGGGSGGKNYLPTILKGVELVSKLLLYS